MGMWAYPAVLVLPDWPLYSPSLCSLYGRWLEVWCCVRCRVGFVRMEGDFMLRIRRCCANCVTVLMASESCSGVCSSQSSNCMPQSINSTQSFNRRFSSCRTTSRLNNTCSAYRTVIHLRRSKSASERAYHPTRCRISLSGSAELLRRSTKVGCKGCDIKLFHFDVPDLSCASVLEIMNFCSIRAALIDLSPLSWIVFAKCVEDSEIFDLHFTSSLACTFPAIRDFAGFL